MLQRRHYPLGEAPHILERHLLRHAAEVERARKRRDAGFLMPAPDRIAAALGIADDNEAASHVGTDITAGKLALRIYRLVNVAVVFHVRTRFARAAFITIRYIDMKFAQNF